MKEVFVSGLSENIDIPGGDAAEKMSKKIGSEITDKGFDMFKKKAGNEAAEVDATKKIDLQMNAKKSGSTPKVHRNSKLSTKPQHG